MKEIRRVIAIVCFTGSVSYDVVSWVMYNKHPSVLGWICDILLGILLFLALKPEKK